MKLKIEIILIVSLLINLGVCLTTDDVMTLRIGIMVLTALAFFLYRMNVKFKYMITLLCNEIDKQGRIFRGQKLRDILTKYKNEL